MTCHSCRIECKRHGRDRRGNQRFKCRQCSKTFLEPQAEHLDGMYLTMEKAEMVLSLLLEGNSVSTIERVTGVHHGTILKLLVLAGEKCERVMATKIVNVQVRDVEADEVWSFIGKKEKRVRPEDDQNLGDCYTFVAIERHSKLALNIAMGKRDQRTTDSFIEGVRHATAHSRFQITTDGFGPYKSAITTTLHDRCDFAQLIKVYRSPQDGEKRYSPAEVSAIEVVPVMGNPIDSRAVQPEPANGNAPVHKTHERFQQEVGKPLGRSRALVLLVQLRARPQITSRHTRDGCWNQRPYLERARTSGGRMSDRIPRMPEDEAVSEKLFLSVATIYQLLIRKGLLTQAEYDAELQVLQALYREVKKGIQDEDLASAFQSLLGERGGPVQ